MNLIKVSVIVVIGLLSFASADVSHVVQNDTTLLPVTDVCLGCICEAASECDRSLKCSGDVCGLFRITWAYWSDSGKPTQQGETADSPNAYSNCVNEPFCAARAIQGYMRRFGQDCNGDGRIDCYDYARVHKFGGYGCRGELEYKYQTRFENCIKTFTSN
ncbi:unnamed protein product [Chironomus riparius]|uniref:lysozyme n=1 Tax=Chironomus riparius TaxID=315576 RepID=A0A9N9WLM2_9DIPT|nr:unnamed protein product [Chironomus riparius]